jgi:hypothetical protein
MKNLESPSTPKQSTVESSTKSDLDEAQPLKDTEEPLTVLSKVAFPGPSKEDLLSLNAHIVAKRQQTQITVNDVVKGFRDLGKNLEPSDLLTILLRAAAKGETEDLFDWILREQFKDNPPADGMDHW